MNEAGVTKENQLKLIEETKVKGSPFKSFFVSMLTRDIQLDDAILDLLDNCVDGIRRFAKLEGDTPYLSYYAHVSFDDKTFSIDDNCGGIPWEMKDYAFRMGKPPDDDPEQPKLPDQSLGAYGIGMKRAIFKIGQQCLISTRNGSNQYEVDVTQAWMANEKEWDLPVKRYERIDPVSGTNIVVGSLHDGVSKTFGENREYFQSELVRKVAWQYAFILEKGLSITINKEKIKPKVPKLIFDDQAGKKGIRPYVFKSTINEVEVFLTVGFTRPIPTEGELTQEQQEPKYSSRESGWTIICNDRAVVFCDTSELTGWGDPPIPRFHTQFIAISGIVEFKSSDSRKLPTTTTKRGIDAAAPLYLQVRHKMREGMKRFTQFTYEWKGREKEIRDQMRDKKQYTFEQIREKCVLVKFNKTTIPIHGEQYMPVLPAPKKPESTTKKISFTKDKTKIALVANYYGDPKMDANDIGSSCFDTIYEEARLKIQ